MPKVFTTKYALTAGIEEIEVEEIGSLGYVYGFRRPDDTFRTQYSPKHFSYTREGAVNQVKEMIARRLKAIDKEAGKLVAFRHELENN